MLSKLIDEINKLQQREGLSDRKFARSLGIDPSLLSRVKNGKASPGGKFLRAVACKYPRLRKYVNRYMESPVKEEAAVCSTE